MKIILAGGTGFIGKALRRELLSAGHEVIVLVRHTTDHEVERETQVLWDGKNLEGWAAYFDGADGVINLVGENIAAKRWTVERKQAIVSSRVDATRVIVRALAGVRKKPSVLINASAVGYYGDIPESALTEASDRGEGFLAETCSQWESEARNAEHLNVRVILARLGPVLGEKGGVLSKMILPFRFFIGAPLGSGRQWVPWIHREDVVGAFLFMLKCKDLSGPVNVTSPVPATMREFCSALAEVLHRPCWPPVPAFFFQGALGEMAAIVLGSQKALPEKLLREGYPFRYPRLMGAFQEILRKRG